MPETPPRTPFDFTLDEIRAWGGERQFTEALEQYTNKGDVSNPAFVNDIGEADITHAGHTIHTRFRTFPGKRRMVENLCPCASSQRDGRICVHMLAAAIALAQREHRDRAAAARIGIAAGRAAVPRGIRSGGSGPRVKFYVPADWRARFAKGSVPLAISVSDGPPRPCSLRDVVERKIPCAPTQEEDDVLFALERLFPVAMPAAAAKTLALSIPSFFTVVERLSEGHVPLYLAGPGPERFLDVKGAELALPSRLHVALDEQTGRLVLSLATDVPGLPEGEVPDYLVYRDAESWENDRAWALQDDALWPLKAVVPSTYADLYFKKEYPLERRETIDFIQREIRGDLPPIGNLRSLHDILGGEFESQVEFSVFTIRPGAPAFALVADGSKASISLSLKAIYSGLPVAAAAPAEGAAPAEPAPADADITVDVVEANPAERFTIPDPKDNFIYYTRNREAEQAALRSLEERGLAREMPPPPSTLSPAAQAAAAAEGRAVEPGPQPLFLPNLVGEKAVLNFLATTVPSLRRDGWKVVLKDSLLAYRQSLPIVAPRVSVSRGAEPGSFLVSYTLETADGKVRLTDEEAASLPKPVRSGRGRAAAAKPPAQDSFVMRDGSPILFDRSALESLRSILAECAGSRKQPKASPEEPLKLSDSYTHFVKASLDALAPSGVTLEHAPEDWLRAADIAAERRALKPAPLGEPVKSLLRPYQTVGVAWLRMLETKAQAGILADEMGLGKTIQTLAWLSLERVRGEKAPALVVCPTSLVENWAHEARHFVPDMKTIVLSGAQRREDFDKIPDADLAITSYALMRRDIEEYRQFRLSAVVLDEAQNIKNQNTQNARSVKMLDPSAARLVVTGTPIENSVSDLWSIMDFLMPGYLGHYETFKRSYEEPLLGTPGSEEYQDAARRIHDKLAPFLLRRLKRQVAKDLPPKVVQIGWCQLSDEQRRVYNRILDESRMQVSGSVKSVGFEKSRMLILTVLLRLRQVCCHLALLGKENPIPDAANPSGKLDHLLDLLDRAMSGGHRTLVFSQFVEMLHIIRDELQKRKIPFCYLDGSSKDRMESVQRFNTDESIPVFLISLKAGGTGLNLTGADEVIHVDPWWNPAVEEQATDRAHRIGQKNTVHSVRLITSDTIEERVLQMQRRKRAIINSTVETGDEQTLAKLTWADVQKLLDLE